MNYLLGLVIALVVISGIGIVYSQTEQIPNWIKLTVEFWVDGITSEQEFISAMEYLIDNEVIVIPKIVELEQEIMRLEQELENIQKQEETSETTSAPSSKTGSAPPGTETQEETSETTSAPYVTADKIGYTLGETIQITGNKSKIHPEKIRYNLNGEPIPLDEVLKINLYLDDEKYDRHVVGIACYIEENELTYCSSGGDYSYSVKKSKSVVKNDGTFAFSLNVNDYYEPGIYYVIMSHSIYSSQENLGSAKSEPFVIQVAPDR